MDMLTMSLVLGGHQIRTSKKSIWSMLSTWTGEAYLTDSSTYPLQRTPLLFPITDMLFSDSEQIIQVIFLIFVRNSISVDLLCTGFWLFHCHFLFHIAIGMNLIIHVGTQADLPPIPPNFPRCGNHLPPITLHWQWHRR